MNRTISRRAFVRPGERSASPRIAGGFLPPAAGRALNPPSPTAEPEAALEVEASPVFAPNGTSCVSINTAILRSDHAQVEMGQGVYTSIAMILAEELDADWQLDSRRSRSAERRSLTRTRCWASQATGNSNIRYARS